jgi:pimeloyl-ACP methyl ester carboxylesterase
MGAGLVSGGLPAARAGNAPGGKIWSAEYWANKGGVKLNLWRKRVGAPQPGEKPLPVLFLVHGSSNSARSSYDLTVPGKGEYSLMNVMAHHGYDVWTMDHDGYGYSGSSGNNSDIASGVEDLKVAMPVIASETSLTRMHFYGTSSGGIRAAAFAQAQPQSVERLVLCAFTYKGTGAAEIARRRKRIDDRQVRRHVEIGATRGRVAEFHFSRDDCLGHRGVIKRKVVVAREDRADHVRIASTPRICAQSVDPLSSALDFCRSVAFVGEGAKHQSVNCLRLCLRVCSRSDCA